MEGSSVKVEIFGHTYIIKGDAPPEYITQLAEFLSNKMEEVSSNIPNTSPTHLAILAALNIADEYFQIKKIKAGADGEIEEKTNALISMLDEGLVGDIFSGISQIDNK